MSKVNLNSVQLTGFIANNIVTNTEGTIYSFGLGVDDSYYKKGYNGAQGEWVNRVCWINCKVFDKNRVKRLSEQNLAKCQVLVSGKIKTSPYTNREGKEIVQTYVLAERIQIISRPEDNQNGQTFQSSAQGDVLDEGYGYLNLEGIDDELPFN